MKSIIFLFDDNLTPSELCKSPIKSIITVPRAFARLEKVIIQRESAPPISIRSQMTTIGERIEVGSLVFSISDMKDSKGNIFNFTETKPIRSLSKLCLIEAGIKIESGICFVFEDIKITILPADYPYSIVLNGIETNDHEFVPEYELIRYSEEKLKF